MARRSKNAAGPPPYQTLTDAQRDRLLRHFRNLEVDGPEAYQEWCRKHGFSPRLLKGEPQRRKEVEHFRSRHAEQMLARTRRVRRNPREWLDALFSGTMAPESLDPDLRRVHDLLPRLGGKEKSRRAFRELLLAVHGRTKLFSARRVIPDYPETVHNSMLGALASLATFHETWIRSPQDWKPRSKSARRQLGELARHLLAEFEVPAFMDSVWFQPSRAQKWFVHLGRGKNIRSAERPFIPLSRRMAHELLLAPASYTVEQAFRWGQIHALGGNRRVVEAVLGTRLGSSFRHDDFWATVIRFFIANPLLDARHYGPIVDYIQHQKFEPQEIMVRPGVFEAGPPPHPGFSMSRRSPEALLRQVRAWHETLGRARRLQGLTWKDSGIFPFELVEGRAGRTSYKRWRITELRSSQALRDEGRAMKHCVETYAGSCARGQSSIWSLTREDRRGEERLLTIAVHPARRTIVEARGRFNRLPTEVEMQMLRRWATQSSLFIPSYVVQ